MSNRFRILMALVWCGCMALDYLSGTAAALHSGSWSSTSARQGLWHKGGMILVVAAAAIADGVLGPLAAQLPQLAGVLPGTGWPGLILPLVLAWYSITELGSVLENAMLLGAPVPGWLSRLLQVSLSTVDRLGSDTADRAETAEATKTNTNTVCTTADGTQEHNQEE